MWSLSDNEKINEEMEKRVVIYIFLINGCPTII
jgi:hypothetical protein